MIGSPEAQIIIRQCTAYLATSPQSKARYMAIKSARQMVQQTGNLPVPLHIRNAPTKLMKEIGYGNNYKYAYDYEGNFVQQEFMPDGLNNTTFYEPANNARENDMRKQLQSQWGKKYRY